MPTHLTEIVVPCYNEARRLQPEGWGHLLAEPAVRLRFVDDGSTDDTARVLDDLASALGPRVVVQRLNRNAGKAEAVRQGLLAALTTDAAVVGYTDADLATPPDELLRLRRELLDGPHQVALGSRVQRLGSQIDRGPLRHYLGRVFATCASLTLGLPAYDTQCGAKLFTRTDALSGALRLPFTSRWAFDVELLGRLYRGTAAHPGLPAGAFVEMPLRRWRDVPGSKVRPWDLPRSLLDLLAIRRALRRYHDDPSH